MFLGHPELYWLMIGVILLCLEMTLPGFVLFFFGMGALITALVCWLGLTVFAVLLPIVWQLLIFLIISLSSLVFLRGKLQKKQNCDGINTPHQRDEDIPTPVKVGEKGVVNIAVKPPSVGQMKCGGSFWQISADKDLDVGEVVVVVKQDNLTIHVEKAV